MKSTIKIARWRRFLIWLFRAEIRPPTVHSVDLRIEVSE